MKTHWYHTNRRLGDLLAIIWQARAAYGALAARSKQPAPAAWLGFVLMSTLGYSAIGLQRAYQGVARLRRRINPSKQNAC